MQICKKGTINESCAYFSCRAFCRFHFDFHPDCCHALFFQSFIFLIFAFIFGLHLGGCSGDLYVTYLFLTKFKNKKVLMRDTGPEQFFYVPDDVAEEINRRRAAGGRIIAVGTTSCRVLESASDASGKVHPVSAETGIFIYPGYSFKATDALITNFHLPESTLIMLVSALAGQESVMAAYRKAVEERYRFFSFGDAMLIV